MTVVNHIYTYQDALDGVPVKGDIPIDFDCLDEPRLSAFLNNPHLSDTSLPMVLYSTVEDKVVGWMMLYPTRIVVDGQYEEALSASDFHVLEEYQRLAVGVDLALFPLQYQGVKYLLYAGPSPIALKMYKKMGFSILTMPYFERKQQMDYVLGRGIKSIIHNSISYFANVFLRIQQGIEMITRKAEKYKAFQFDIVPEWVDTIFNHNEKRFCEVHDRKWLQWCLDNRYHGEAENCQRFFGVFKDDVPVGFFLTTERFRCDRVYGFLMEWESIDRGLTELLIIRMALSTFSPSVKRVGITLNELSYQDSLKKIRFTRKDDFHIVFKDLTHQLTDSHCPENWRLRFGYADVVLSG